MTIAEVHFKEKPEDAEPEALQMEHFYLPLGMWFVGIIVSLFLLLAEIVIHRGYTFQSSSDIVTSHDVIVTSHYCHILGS